MIRLGILGMSEGNGHPYSWSAIFNGYDPAHMALCPYAAIPTYLAERRFPDDQIAGARVTHVWCQDRTQAEAVAAAALVDVVVDRPEEMIGQVDAVLLARDDPETHLELARPFLLAGLPVYIDKPLATSRAAAREIFALEQWPGQVFTCSALRYAAEFSLSAAERAELGALRHIQATTPKDWKRYAIHVIDPLLRLAGPQGRVVSHARLGHREAVTLSVAWESGLTATISALGGGVAAPLDLRLLGAGGRRQLAFADSFSCFRAALADFIEGVRRRERRIGMEETMAAMELVELGMEGASS